MEITLQLGAIVITLLWIYVMFILADFPSFGIYLIMLKSVAKVLIKFLALFSFIIVAFSLGFHLLVPGTGHENPLLSILTTLGNQVFLAPTGALDVGILDLCLSVRVSVYFIE